MRRCVDSSGVRGVCCVLRGGNPALLEKLGWPERHAQAQQMPSAQNMIRFVFEPPHSEEEQRAQPPVHGYRRTIVNTLAPAELLWFRLLKVVIEATENNTAVLLLCGRATLCTRSKNHSNISPVSIAQLEKKSACGINLIGRLGTLVNSRGRCLTTNSWASTRRRHQLPP